MIFSKYESKWFEYRFGWNIPEQEKYFAAAFWDSELSASNLVQNLAPIGSMAQLYIKSEGNFCIVWILRQTCLSNRKMNQKFVWKEILFKGFLIFLETTLVTQNRNCFKMQNAKLSLLKIIPSRVLYIFWSYLFARCYLAHLYHRLWINLWTTANLYEFFFNSHTLHLH